MITASQSPSQELAPMTIPRSGTSRRVSGTRHHAPLPIPSSLSTNSTVATHVLAAGNDFPSTDVACPRNKHKTQARTATFLLSPAAIFVHLESLGLGCITCCCCCGGRARVPRAERPEQGSSPPTNRFRSVGSGDWLHELSRMAGAPSRDMLRPVASPFCSPSARSGVYLHQGNTADE